MQNKGTIASYVNIYLSYNQHRDPSFQIVFGPSPSIGLVDITWQYCRQLYNRLILVDHKGHCFCIINKQHIILLNSHWKKNYFHVDKLYLNKSSYSYTFVAVFQVSEDPGALHVDGLHNLAAPLT